MPLLLSTAPVHIGALQLRLPCRLHRSLHSQVTEVRLFGKLSSETLGPALEHNAVFSRHQPVPFGRSRSVYAIATLSVGI